VFHRIYEAMGLGMHPASPYPRRSRVAPMWTVHPRQVCARDPALIVRPPPSRVKRLCPLELSGYNAEKGNDGL
jgi:hypothetical protein